MQPINCEIDFEIAIQKVGILLLKIGSISPAVSFNKREKIAMLIIGDTIINSNINTPTIPIEFLIIILPATIKSKPLLNNPPTIGIEFDIAYFAALIETPSKVALVIPWIDKNIENIVMLNPIIHFIIELKKSANLFNFTLSEKMEISWKVQYIRPHSQRKQ